MENFDNTLNIDESIIVSINNMIKYQNYKLLELIKTHKNT